MSGQALAASRRTDARKTAGIHGFLVRFISNIPNLITVARMVMAPVAVQMIVSDRYLAAFLIFLLAGVSDGVDGFIARRFDLRTELGAYLDPLADKALLISIYVSLAIYGALPAWVAIAVVSRDVDDRGRGDRVLAARQAGRDPPGLGIEAQHRRPDRARRLRARRARLRHSNPFPTQTGLEWLVAATVVASAGVYIAQWLDHMTR